MNHCITTCRRKCIWLIVGDFLFDNLEISLMAAVELITHGSLSGKKKNQINILD